MIILLLARAYIGDQARDGVGERVEELELEVGGRHVPKRRLLQAVGGRRVVVVREGIQPQREAVVHGGFHDLHRRCAQLQEGIPVLIPTGRPHLIAHYRLN